MRHALFGTTVCNASVAILIKESGFNSRKIEAAYITPIGANPKAFVAFSLWYNEAGRCPAALAKEYLSDLLAEIQQLGVSTLLVTDGNYFKFLTKKTKAEPFCGYALDCAYSGYEKQFTVIYAPNYYSVHHNPQNQEKIDRALQVLQEHIRGTYREPGSNIIHSAQYPSSPEEIERAFAFLHTRQKLTVDIESRGLEFWNCGISTIAFAWDKHNFTSIAVDRGEHSSLVRTMLKHFFETYQGTLILHNAGFDFKVLIHELWMTDLQDYVGMIDGIEYLTRNFDDTKIITYLATNNAVENVLGLKPLSAEFTGNYAQEDIEDTEKIPLPQLLEYNGVDCLATWYVYEKYLPVMIADDQETIYHELFKPSVITLLATELHGMPIFPEKVQQAKQKLLALVAGYRKTLMDSVLIQEFHLEQQQKKCEEFTKKAKKKVFTMDDPKVQAYLFNPNSGPQLQALIYEYMGFPVIDLTDSKQPATGGKTLKKLLNHAVLDEHREIFEALIGLAEADKILTSFIPAFEKAVQQPDSTWRLYGNFNLGGTKSGRLSSSNPNLTNIPSHSTWAKIIKECFGCEPGKIFAGADANSLEDMISALTTRDKNKMLVYTQGFDGHSLRAYAYYKEQMPDITAELEQAGDDEEAKARTINSIADTYPHLRQKSKPKTFLLTYGGTYHGLMANMGLPEDEAKSVETNYHTLYVESDQWVAERIEWARRDGYVTGAFGLRLRTPLLAFSPKGKLSYGAAAESRTAGNMLGQSYCMLNSRAANEFRERVWASPYRYDIFLVAHIHDANYVVFKDTLAIAEWVNRNLIECMSWCGLEELQHPIVKLGASLEIFYPSWNQKVSIPNAVNMREIKTLCRKHFQNLKEKSDG